MKGFLEPLESRKRRRTTLADTRKSLIAARDNVKRALANHRNFDPKQCAAEVSQLQLAKEQVSESVASAETTLQILTEQLSKLTAGKVSLLKFRTYFSPEQKLLRSQETALKGRVSDVRTNKKLLEDKLKSISDQIQHKTRDLVTFKAFDYEVNNNQLMRLISEISLTTKKISDLDEKIGIITKKIDPSISEYKKIKERSVALKTVISDANRLDDELNLAKSGRQSREIHRDCEERFGHPSPKKVRSDALRELRSIETNALKLERRIRDELRKIDMIVSHIIIDGNNTCYERSNFIRLHALTNLIDVLSINYKVTVVFDASIRSLMKTDDAGISRIIGPQAKVYVAPTRTGADEYILNLANEKPESWIVSNDRFVDFGEYEVVKSGRLMRFLIANDQIILNDLDICIPFRSSTEPR